MDMDMKEKSTGPNFLGNSPKQVQPEDAALGNILEISEEELQVVEGFLLHKVLEILGM